MIFRLLIFRPLWREKWLEIFTTCNAKGRKEFKQTVRAFWSSEFILLTKENITVCRENWITMTLHLYGSELDLKFLQKFVYVEPLCHDQRVRSLKLLWFKASQHNNYKSSIYFSSISMKSGSKIEQRILKNFVLNFTTLKKISVSVSPNKESKPSKNKLKIFFIRRERCDFYVKRMRT